MEVCQIRKRATQKQKCVVGDSRDGAVAAGEAAILSMKTSLSRAMKLRVMQKTSTRTFFVLCLSSADKEDINDVWKDL